MVVILGVLPSQHFYSARVLFGFMEAMRKAGGNVAAFFLFAVYLSLRARARFSKALFPG